MAVSYATYERVALEDDSAIWELVCGRLREKQGMTQEHNRLARRLSRLLAATLDPDRYEVGESFHVRVSTGTYLIPDVAVVAWGTESEQQWTGHLEVYEGPLPFVAEVWSPSTVAHDLETKLPLYQERQDAVIWHVDAAARTVTAHELQADGQYRSESHTSGAVTIPSLSMSVALDELFVVLQR